MPGQLSALRVDSQSRNAKSAFSADSQQNSYDPYLGELKSNLTYAGKDQFEDEGSETSETPMIGSHYDSNPEDLVSRGRSNGVPKILVIPKKIECCRNRKRSSIHQGSISPFLAKARNERNYWNKIVSNRISYHGTVNIRVGEGLLLLGTAHMRCKEYDDALKVFKSAALIFRTVYGDMHLCLARSLNKVGLAASRLCTTASDNLAFKALHESFDIRLKKLGPYHIDTVDSLNNIAGLNLRLHKYNSARKAYHEVYLRRQFIFGQNHPSVAITAHALGGVYMQLAQLNHATKYYQRAMDLYLSLKLKDENQSIQRLLRDISALERVGNEIKTNS
mmetsp:Transcript_23116/g.34131  ORF Transcript_23116/g.34131 Transcript_23116/m.34131 type:complete len:334 (-) Transcript_23116:144-1145(-)|eukprot:CAMPEP_0194207400 /NCGR_PEP_ID=MMETSP0156-20130528/6158_1 /TAXON_ID=33649 /ORGANISM="Thalassionema nitzschioides, Strain L26-B" /LENGTH=333 /DNA_ID=CAMNT_0038934159 /DNA_START=379 /DNA_END=1380 /DNA_ORIENTATION=-